MYKFLIAVSCMFLITACDPGPNDSITKSLAIQYLASGSIGGNVPVQEDMIKVLKSYEKEGAPVMTFQVGGMICDMPVLKTDQGWISRGISCNGRIYTPEQEQQARIQKAKERHLSAYRQQSEDLKTNGPKTDADGEIQARSVLVSGDHVTIDIAFLPLETAADLPDENLKMMKEQVEVDRLKMCKDISNEIDLGISITQNMVANDGTLVLTYPLDKASCDALSRQKVGLAAKKSS